MLTPTPFDSLDPTLVTQTLAALLESVQEDNPTLEVTRGALADTLIYYNGLLGAQRQDLLNQYWLGRSLQSILADPAGVDNDLIDAVLSNYNVTRRTGAAATGEIVIVVSRDTTTIIGKGSTWQANGLTFFAPNVFTAKTDEDQINNANDRLLTPTTEGNWSFSINVTAVALGAAGNLAQNTTATPATTPPNFVKAYVADDFTGGQDVETNEAVLARLSTGIAAPIMAGRGNLLALLQQNAQFAGIVASSIIGMGQSEMVRDRHWIFPVSGGGRADWYVRTQAPIAHLVLSKTGTLITKNHDGTSVWQIAIAKDDAPGFYDIPAIYLPANSVPSSGFAITQEIRSVDLSGTGLLPDIDAATDEGVYSRYQTAIVQFTDTTTVVTSLSLGATQTYSVSLRYLPLVDTLQDYINGSDVSGIVGDCLVKAAVPCFVSLAFTIHNPAGQPAPDVAAIRTALAQAIAGVGFTGLLYASMLSSVIVPYLSGMSLSAIAMTGSVYSPNGTITELSSAEVLTVPDAPSQFVSANTVQFFCAVTDITITVS